MNDGKVMGDAENLGIDETNSLAGDREKASISVNTNFKLDAKSITETEVITNDVEDETESSSCTERTESSDADLGNV